VAEERVYSWRAITDHAVVIASDGKEVGWVVDVAALPEEDIFHGVVFRSHIIGKNHMAPADDIGEIGERKVHLTVDSEAAAQYPEFHELDVERLGIKGLFFWKHAGWHKSKE
jgi:hypothetical protein